MKSAVHHFRQDAEDAGLRLFDDRLVPFQFVTLDAVPAVYADDAEEAPGFVADIPGAGILLPSFDRIERDHHGIERGVLPGRVNPLVDEGVVME